MDIAFLIGRILLGGYFIMFGLMHLMKSGMFTQMAQSRGMSAAKPMVILSGLWILLGGLGILLGVYVSYALGGLIIFLVLAAFMMHHFWTDEDPKARMMQKMHFLTNLAMSGALLMMYMISEPWVMSLSI